ncbi:MAG: hypothetical protein NW207_12400 [Cytophagales bacterium]|nr:hypothetical protein [Cytophagales bacterium]
MAFTQRDLNKLKKVGKYTAVLRKYSAKPTIKNIDIEEIKKQFAQKAAEVTKPASKKQSEPKAETVQPVVAEAPVITSETVSENTVAQVAEVPAAPSETNTISAPTEPETIVAESKPAKKTAKAETTSTE